MPTSSEYVRSSGWTGNGRPRVKTALLTPNDIESQGCLAPFEASKLCRRPYIMGIK